MSISHYNAHIKKWKEEISQFPLSLILLIPSLRLPSVTVHGSSSARAL